MGTMLRAVGALVNYSLAVSRHMTPLHLLSHEIIYTKYAGSSARNKERQRERKCGHTEVGKNLRNALSTEETRTSTPMLLTLKQVLHFPTDQKAV